MKKKILLTMTLVFVMFFNVFLFTGCSFVTTNTSKYYNTVIAKVGDTEITKYEVLSAYNSYGYDYVQSSGYTVEKAVETIVNQLINREVICKYVTENFKTLFGYDELKSWEISEIWQNVFDYINSSEVLEYVNKIRTNKGLSTISDETTSSNDETTYIRQHYDRQIVIETDDNNSIKKITSKPSETHDEKLNLSINDFEYEFYGDGNYLDTEINELARKEFISYLRLINTDKKLKTDDALLKNHLEELFKSNKKTYLIEKFKEDYNDNKEISIASILEKYKEAVKGDYQKYSNDKAGYISAVQSDASKVYYHAYEDELIYVTHILIKYDKSKDTFDLRSDYKSRYESGEIETIEEYEELIKEENLMKKCDVYEIVDGKFEENPTDMNAQDLYNMIDSDLSQIDNKDERLSKFIDYAYKFNQDTAMFNTETFYTVQLDTDYSDTMVTEFADLSRKLYKEGGVGSYGICTTTYGTHIVYIAGKVENQIINSVDSDIDNILSTITIDQLRNVELKGNKYYSGEKAENPNYDDYKTLLDEFASKVVIDDYDSYISIKLDEIKNDLGKEIVIYKNRYKDLLGK